MEKVKQKLLLRSSGREAHANEDRNLNANSARVGVSTDSESGGQVKEETRPWGLKELCTGRDPIIE